MPDVAFDRFYRYDELTEILQGWAEEQPELFRVESIGKSYEGRDIWLATVTNFETGADLDKPGSPRRGEHPRARGDGLHGGAAPPRQAPTRLRERSEGDALPRHARLLRRAAAEP